LIEEEDILLQDAALIASMGFVRVMSDLSGLSRRKLQRQPGSGIVNIEIGV
jgi:hypothetical protein